MAFISEMFFSEDHTGLILALLGGGFVLLCIIAGVVWVLSKKLDSKLPQVLVCVFESFHFLFLFFTSDIMVYANFS